MHPTDILSSTLNHPIDFYPTNPFGRPALQPGEFAARGKTGAGGPEKPTATDHPDDDQREAFSRRLAVERLIAKFKIKALPGCDHVIDYIRHLYRRNCRANTIKNVSLAMEMFLLFLRRRGKEHLELIEKRDLEAFAEHEHDRGMKPRTVRFRIHLIYAFFRYLSDKQIIKEDILKRRIRFKIAQSLPKAIPPADIRRFLKSITDVRDRAMFVMLLRTGMRIGELLNLKATDVDLPERVVKIYKGEKNSVGRVVYLSDDAAAALEAWLKIRDSSKRYLFYGVNGRLGYTGVTARFKGIWDKAGLLYKGYTLHCMRHTFATDLLNAGMRLECLQQLLGHSSIEVTRIYARLSDATREDEYFKAMEKIERGQSDECHQLDCQL